MTSEETSIYIDVHYVSNISKQVLKSDTYNVQLVYLKLYFFFATRSSFMTLRVLRDYLKKNVTVEPSITKLGLSLHHSGFLSHISLSMLFCVYLQSFNHKWHVHANPEGDDTYAAMGDRCMSLGGHYNPYYVNLRVSIIARATLLITLKMMLIINNSFFGPSRKC